MPGRHAWTERRRADDRNGCRFAVALEPRDRHQFGPPLAVVNVKNTQNMMHCRECMVHKPMQRRRVIMAVTTDGAYRVMSQHFSLTTGSTFWSLSVPHTEW